MGRWYTPTSCARKILASFSDVPWMYGRPMLVPARFGLSLSLGLALGISKAQSSYWLVLSARFTWPPPGTGLLDSCPGIGSFQKCTHTGAFVFYVMIRFEDRRSCRRKPDEVDVTFAIASITSYQDSERYRTSLLNMTESDNSIHPDIVLVLCNKP